MSTELSTQRKLIFAALTAVLVLIFIEVLLQGFYLATVGEFLFRRASLPMYEEDPVRCYRLQPNLDFTHRTNEFELAVYTDSRGFRSDARHTEVPVEKANDVYRVLFTGPSFAFGWGADYEKIYPTLIGEMLEVPGKRIEVLNIGTPAQGPAQQLCWIQEYGAAFEPDLVVHTAYGRVVPTFPTACPVDPECPSIVDGYLVRVNPSAAYRIKAFIKNFATVFYGYYAYNFVMQPEPAEDESKSLHGAESRIGSNDADAVAESYLAYASETRRILGDQTLVAFVYLPFSYAVHPEDTARFTDVRPEDVPRTRREITATAGAMRDAGVPFVNTLPALVEAADTERLYWWLDIHFTDAGNAVVAEVASDYLQELIDSDEGSARTTIEREE